MDVEELVKKNLALMEENYKLQNSMQVVVASRKSSSALEIDDRSVHLRR